MDFAKKSMKGQQGGERGEGGASFHLRMAVMTSILYGWGPRERTCSYNAGFLLSILHWCKIHHSVSSTEFVHSKKEYDYLGMLIH